MATFPAIEPLGRDYGLGDLVVSVVAAQNGDSTPFAHSSVPHAIPISLQFPALTLSEVQQIRDHYAGQRGQVREFALPPELWRMHSNLYDVWPSGTLFTYAGPHAETPRPGGLFDVSVPLLSI
jgi:hypothetical protein